MTTLLSTITAQAFSRLFFIAAALLAFAPLVDAQSLGSAVDFAVLGASTVTSAGASHVSGSVGVSPGIAVHGFPPGVSGSLGLNLLLRLLSPRRTVAIGALAR